MNCNAKWKWCVRTALVVVAVMVMVVPPVAMVVGSLSDLGGSQFPTIVPANTAQHRAEQCSVRSEAARSCETAQVQAWELHSVAGLLSSLGECMQQQAQQPLLTWTSPQC